MKQINQLVKGLLGVVLLFSLQITNAQVQDDPEWKFEIADNIELNREVTLLFKAQVPTDWYMYANDFDPNLGPILSSLYSYLYKY